MIKTEFFDENYNEVEPENAKRIVQLFFDDSGRMIKKIEWAPKEKFGYRQSNRQAHQKVANDALLRSIQEQHLDIVVGMQCCIDDMWHCHAIEKNNYEKSKISKAISDSYFHLMVAMDDFERRIKREGERF